jgi:uncharacterized membrane protein
MYFYQLICIYIKNSISITRCIQYLCHHYRRHNLHVHVMFIPSLYTSQSSCICDVHTVIVHVTIFMYTWCSYRHCTRHNIHIHVMFISSLYTSQSSYTRDVYIVIIHVTIVMYTWCLYRHYTRHNRHVHVMFISSLYTSWLLFTYSICKERLNTYSNCRNHKDCCTCFVTRQF